MNYEKKILVLAIFLLDQGTLVNENSFWQLTGSLVTRTDIPVDQTQCGQKSLEKINMFLPIPQLTYQDAVDLCSRFGESSYIAGDFEDKEDFDRFYDGLFSNEKYVEMCSYFDNGRLKTWLPYAHNEDSSALVHRVNGQKLLWKIEEKFYVSWYGGPRNTSTNRCVDGFFGPSITPRYENIGEEDLCSAKKCTACEIQNSLAESSVLSLRGLCQYSSFDTTYQVQYTV